MQLQDVMAWLSTLGGAYSAMGDHLCKYVSDLRLWAVEADVDYNHSMFT